MQIPRRLRLEASALQSDGAVASNVAVPPNAPSISLRFISDFIASNIGTAIPNHNRVPKGRMNWTFNRRDSLRDSGLTTRQPGIETPYVFSVAQICNLS